MIITYFEKFESAKNLGVKSEAKTNIDLFVKSFEGTEEEFKWIKQYLESRKYGHKVRHELYEHIIFPYLLKNYEERNPWSMYWLAETIQNLYGTEKLHKQIGLRTDFGLLKECFELDSENDAVRIALLSRMADQFIYAVHEWPTGVLYAPDEKPQDLLEELEFARSIDKEKNYHLLFDEVIKIVHQDMQRAV